METTSTIFCFIFLAIGICATLGALGGAAHQWYLAVLSFFISSILVPEAIENQPGK